MKIELKVFQHLYPDAMWWIKRFDDEGAYYDNYSVYSGNNSSIEEKKIVLRPLSDMTEDEYKYLGFSDHGIEMIKSGKDEFTQIWTAIELIYLLKQGFDLFGLIESSQAIDKTTLNPTP